MPQTLRKQPDEDRLYDMDMSPRLAVGESINAEPTVTERTVAEDGTRTTSSDLTIGTPSYSGAIAQVRISGGLDGVLYEVTFLCPTDASNIVEGEGLLCVEDT